MDLQKNLFMFVKVNHLKVMRVFNEYIRLIQIEKIKHISSYDTNTKIAYNVDEFENIIYWSKELAISYNIDKGDNTANYETYSFIKNKLIVSAHYPNGDMVVSTGPIDKYFFNQLYDCSKD